MRASLRIRLMALGAVAFMLSACSPPALLRSERQAAHAYEGGHLQMAARRYARLVKAAPRNPLFLARLGNCEVLLGHAAAAAQAYTRALRLSPSLTVVRYNLAQIRIRQAYVLLAGARPLPKGGGTLNSRLRALRRRIRALLEVSNGVSRR